MTVQWDIPLLDGYSWLHVLNRGNGQRIVLGDPGLWSLIRKGSFDAVLLHIGYVRAFWTAYLAARLSESAFQFGTDASSVAPPKDVVRAYMWFRLAGTEVNLADAKAQMTAARVREAERMATEWKNSPPER